MKKVLFVAVVGLVVFSSCRKERTCVCIYSDGTSFSETYPMETKKDAEAKCKANQYVGLSCELK